MGPSNLCRRLFVTAAGLQDTLTAYYNTHQSQTQPSVG